MNVHLEKAKEYAAKGEAYYRKAAEEIIAARKNDFALTYREIAEELGRSESWCKELVAWITNGRDTDQTPFAGARPERYEENRLANPELQEKAVERVIRDRPELIAEKLAAAEPGSRRRFHEAQDDTYRETTERSRQRQREAIGERESDELQEAERLREAEAELFKARRAIIETLRALNDLGGSIPDTWREELLRTLDDIAAKVELGRGLLTGGEAIDEALQRLLEGGD